MVKYHCLQDGRLPGVETSVVETSVESWSKAKKQLESVDAVLLISMAHHVHPADRKALFQKLMTRYLSCGGLVVILDYITSVPSRYHLLMERFGVRWSNYDVIESEMVKAGFCVVYQTDIEIRYDYSNPSDGLVKFVQLIVGRDFSEVEVRAAIDDIYDQPDVCLKKLTIFTK